MEVYGHIDWIIGSYRLDARTAGRLLIYRMTALTTRKDKRNHNLKRYVLGKLMVVHRDQNQLDPQRSQSKKIKS